MKYSFFYIDESYKQQWDSLVGKNPATSFTQLFVAADYRRASGWKTYKIGMKDESGKFIGGAIVLRGTHDENTDFLYMPLGPVLPYDHLDIDEMFDAFIAEVLELATREGKKQTAFLRFDPLLTQFPNSSFALCRSPRIYEPEVSRVIDLRLSEEDILAQMKIQCRYNVRLGIKKGVRVYEDTSVDGRRIFIKLHQTSMRRKQYPERTVDYFNALFNAFIESKTATILIAKHEDTPLVAGFFAMCGDRFMYYYTGSSDEKRNLHGANVLLWEAMKLAKSRGFTKFDLWGLAYDPKDTTHPFYSYSHFKDGFGGSRIEYAGSMDIVINQALYDRYVESFND